MHSAKALRVVVYNLNMQIYKHTLLALAFFLPVITFAQDGAQQYLVNITLFVGNVVVPFLLGIAFLFFVVNVIRFFVFESNNEQGREKAKSLAVFGIGAFVVILIFWGIINILTDSLGFDCREFSSDYITKDLYGPPVNPCR